MIASAADDDAGVENWIEGSEVRFLYGGIFE
jgi:hypothetical protein